MKIWESAVSFHFWSFSSTDTMDVIEAKRQRIADLIHAHVSNRRIMDIVGCSKELICKVKRLLRAGESLKRRPGCGGKNKIRTEEFLTGVASEIEADGTISMRKLAKELKVSPITIRRSVRDLGAFSYVRRRRQLLTDAIKKRRVEKGKKLLNRIKKEKRSTMQIFSDKKNWTVDQSRNSRNDRYLAYCVEEVPPIHCTKNPASSMMLGVIASDGNRMPPYWFPKGLRVGTEEYLDVLQTVVKPWLDAQYPEGNYVFQQDSAPSHKSKKTQAWCKDNLADFWSWTIWPPSSPDLNPMDFATWGAVESKACSSPHPSVDAMKASVELEWTNMSVDFVKSSCSKFRPRLEALLEAEGGHFET